MPFDQNNLPEWNAPGVEPPQSKKDSGWGAQEKPPGDWFNWFFNKTYNALKSLFTNAQHKEEKGQPNGYASLDGSGKVPTAQLPTATPTSPGAMSAADKSKLDGIQPGAEPNQNAFSNVKVGSTTLAADSKTDTLELVAGTNITLTPDAASDKITIAATVPVTSVNGKTGNVSLTASDVGAETPAGAQAKASAAEANAKAASAPISHVGAGGSVHATATQTTAGFMSAADKAKLDGIAAGAEVNQNTFSNVKVGATTIAADAKQDTLELVAGTGVVLTPDAANDKVTIAVNTASTSQAGIVQLNDSVNSTSTTQAATANAVKKAYEKGVEALNAANAAKMIADAVTGKNYKWGIENGMIYLEEV
jgi:Phage tail fibre repeat